MPNNVNGYCPICRGRFRDAISHFLLNHPEDAVPLRIVLDWIEHSSLRCPVCYVPCDDVSLHFDTEHVKSVRLHFDYDEMVERGEDGLFTCPLCTEKFCMSDTFEVRLDYDPTCNPTRRSYPP